MSKSLKLIYEFYKELAPAPEKLNERSLFLQKMADTSCVVGSSVSLFWSEIDKIMGKNAWIYTEYTKKQHI